MSAPHPYEDAPEAHDIDWIGVVVLVEFAVAHANCLSCLQLPGRMEVHRAHSRHSRGEERWGKQLLRSGGNIWWPLHHICSWHCLEQRSWQVSWGCMPL